MTLFTWPVTMPNKLRSQNKLVGLAGLAQQLKLGVICFRSACFLSGLRKKMLPSDEKPKNYEDIDPSNRPKNRVT